MDPERREFMSHACRLILTTSIGLSALEALLIPEAEAAVKKSAPNAQRPTPNTQHPNLTSKLQTTNYKPSRLHIPESPPVFITADYRPPISGEYRARIERATLEFLHDKYRDKPFWGARKISDVGIEKRVHWILYWIMRGIEEARGRYPVDPLLLMAQMHEESRFYEFAISPAAAAGVAQFIKPAARSYGMVCAGKTNAQGRAMSEHAGAYERFLKIRSERARAARVIRDIEDVPESYLDLKEMSREQQAALRDYRRFLYTNVKGRDIFDEKDRKFLEGFDQRFGYRRAIPAMAAYMAANLHECNGYVAAALIGYNAGMGWVREKKGRMPMIKESIRYAEAIQFTYRDIARRANA